MKKTYTKPNMEIVSLATESITADTGASGNLTLGGVQTTSAMKTIKYY